MVGRVLASDTSSFTQVGLVGLAALRYSIMEAWLSSWMDLLGELEDYVENFYPNGVR